MHTKPTSARQSFLSQFLTVLLIIMMLLGSSSASIASAAETPYFSPSVAATNGSGWTNISYSFTADDQYASTAGRSKQLRLSYFNIDPIQGNSTITGIAVAIEGHTDGRQGTVAISGDNGVTWSTAKNLAVATGNTDSTQTLGGASDLWGLTWTGASFSNTNFLVRVTSAATNNGTLYLDQLQVKVYFTPPDTTLTVSPVSENYGTSTTTLTATLTETNGGAPIGGMTVDFKLNNVSVGSVVTNGSGVASLANVDISTLAAGVYEGGIRADFAAAGGYDATFGLADLTIVGLPLTVTADPQTKYYGYIEPTLTYQLTAGTLLPGDSFSGNLSREPGELPGAYFINQGSLTAGPGYAITFVGDFLTIDQAPLTVTADSFSKLATDPAITSFTFTYDGFVFAEDATALATEPTCALEPGADQSVAGTYSITCSGGVADNYSFDYVAGSLTVAPVAEPPLELISVAAQDGWVLESGETTSRGGSANAGNAYLRVGDDALNRQYRSILSFNTSSLPANATITKVTLKLTYAGKAGTSPFNTHRSFLVDLKIGTFGTTSLLQRTDFQSAATLNAAGIVGSTPVSPSVHEAVLTQNALDSLNLNIGFTQLQLRLRFQRDDNNDFGADFLKFFSGNSTIVNTQPVLIIEYTLP